MTNKLKLLLSGVILVNTSTWASIDKLLPKPQHIEVLNGKCNTSRLKPEGLYLQDELKDLLLRQGYTIDNNSPIVIRTTIVPSLPKVYFNKLEAYRLRIAPDGIYIYRCSRTHRSVQRITNLGTADDFCRKENRARSL